MEHTINFLGALPRSGSTLLCNILLQNPRFHATATSGILDVLLMVRNNWNQLEFVRAMKDEDERKQKEIQVLRGILLSYFEDVDKPIIFDKSRGWLAHLEMAESVLGYKAKVICPVRDLRDILASFEKLWRNNAAFRQFQQEAMNLAQWQTIEGRCKIWADQAQPLGLAYNMTKDAIDRGFRDRMHFVPYEELTAHPVDTLKGIHDFLGEEPFKYDFDHVEQITTEDDGVFGIDGLHKIRQKVEPQKATWVGILPKEVADQYKGQELW